MSWTRRSFFAAARRPLSLGVVAAGATARGRAAAAARQSSPLLFPAAPAAQASSRYVNPRNVLLWENTRKEVREAIAGGRLKAAIVPTGSTEQHNEHLALICDTACSTLIAQQAALALYPRVTVATPCPVGYAPYHMERKGTLTLRKETFLAYVFDVIESLKTHGLRTVLVVNGHAGNHKLLHEALPGWRSRLGITLDAVSYWNGYSPEDFRTHLQSGSGVSHAAEFETSLLLAAFPDRVRPFTMKEYDDARLDFDDETVLTPAGENARDRKRQEEALLATREKGEALIALAARFVAGTLERMMAQGGAEARPSERR
jgi:creatinine amidohydrolase